MISKSPRLSVCMIVKNEGHQLAEALGNFRQFADEIVVVDTGSSDNTREIASQLSDGVFDFPWCDDFAAARNHSVERARGRYVLWMDADDRVEPEMVQRIGELKASFDGRKAFFFVLQDMNGNGPSASFYQLRCAPRLQSVRFEGKIHERLNIEGLQPCATDVVVRHYGYIDRDIQQAKARRNLEMLERELRSGSDDPYLYYYISLSYEGLDRIAEAIHSMQTALSHAERQVRESRGPAERQLRLRYLVEAHFHLARLYHKTKQDSSAVQHLMTAQAAGGADARFLFKLGSTYQQVKCPTRALECLRGALAGEGSTDLFPSIPLPPREQILVHIALAQWCLRDHAAAMENLREAWAMGLPPLLGWESLGFLALMAEEWSIALHAYENASLLGEMSETGFFFLGTLYKQRRLFQKAIGCYEKVLRLNPAHSGALAALRELHQEGENRVCEMVHVVLPHGQGRHMGASFQTTNDCSEEKRP